MGEKDQISKPIRKASSVTTSHLRKALASESMTTNHIQRALQSGGSVKSGNKVVPSVANDSLTIEHLKRSLSTSHYKQALQQSTSNQNQSSTGQSGTVKPANEAGEQK